MAGGQNECGSPLPYPRPGDHHLCTVAILPTLHHLHKDPAFAHYDYDALRSLILTFDPDCICGEIRPEDWAATAGGSRPGYCGPVEYRECILPLCLERAIPFRAIDAYRDEDATGALPVANPSTVEASDTLLDLAWQAVTDVFLHLIRRSECGAGAIFDPAVMDVIRAKHRLQQQATPIHEARTWQVRNLRMAANIVDVCADYLGGKVLVTVGLEHVPFLWDSSLSVTGYACCRSIGGAPPGEVMAAPWRGFPHGRRHRGGRLLPLAAQGACSEPCLREGRCIRSARRTGLWGTGGKEPGETRCIVG